MDVLLITGANGEIGQELASYLHDRYALRLLVWDLGRAGVRSLPPALGDVRRVDIQDRAAVLSAMEGVDTVIHLAGQREVQARWHELRGPNIEGVVNVFQAATEMSVRKLIFASSNHVTGGYDRVNVTPISPRLPVWPDSLYGVTKAFGEALGRYLADVGTISVICLRIGWFLSKPHNETALRMWLSPRDLHRLIDCCLATNITYGVYYAASANTRGTWDMTNAKADLGYEPLDDSEAFAAEVLLSTHRS